MYILENLNKELQENNKKLANLLRALENGIFNDTTNDRMRELEIANKELKEKCEKIRTYNFPEQRVTDHRIKLTLYKLDDILAGGAALDEMIDALIAADQLEQLANME